MKLKNMSREELEMMSYAEIASLILTENKKKMKIAEVFKKICDLLGLSDAEYENGISEFFEIVSTNKLFTVLPQGFCDLKVRHKTKIVLDDEDDESSVDEESEEETDENGMCDTMDLIDEILGFPKKTPEEKVEYLKRVEERRQRLIELERENQEWQEFKRPYLLEAEQRAARDYEEYKKSKSSEQAHRTRTNVNKSNHNL